MFITKILKTWHFASAAAERKRKQTDVKQVAPTLLNTLESQLARSLYGCMDILGAFNEVLLFSFGRKVELMFDS